MQAKNISEIPPKLCFLFFFYQVIVPLQCYASFCRTVKPSVRWVCSYTRSVFGLPLTPIPHRTPLGPTEHPAELPVFYGGFPLASCFRHGRDTCQSEPSSSPRTGSPCQFSMSALPFLPWEDKCAALSCSVVSDPGQPHDWSPPGSSVLGDSSGRNTGGGFHFLLQEIFPTQGLNPGLLHCRWILYHLSHQGSPKIDLSVPFF